MHIHWPVLCRQGSVNPCGWMTAPACCIICPGSSPVVLGPHPLPQTCLLDSVWVVLFPHKPRWMGLLLLCLAHIFTNLKWPEQPDCLCSTHPVTHTTGIYNTSPASADFIRAGAVASCRSSVQTAHAGANAAPWDAGCLQQPRTRSPAPIQTSLQGDSSWQGTGPLLVWSTLWLACAI